MGTKTKAFDCVEMKRQAQARLRAEFESRKPEFGSYFDFLQWKADHSEIARRVREKIARAAASRGDT